MKKLISREELINGFIIHYSDGTALQFIYNSEGGNTATVLDTTISGVDMKCEIIKPYIWI